MKHWVIDTNVIVSGLLMILATLRSHRMVVTMQRLSDGPDPDDLMFIEVALETPQKTIVTGNLKDFPRAIRHGVRILTPAQAAEEL